MKVLKKADEITGKVFSFLGIADMIILGIILFLNVLVRFCGLPLQLSWYSEVVEISFAWLVMIGAVILCRNSAHFRVDLFVQKFGHRRGYYWLEAVCFIIALVFYCYLLYYSYSLAINATQTMPVLHISKGYAYACMPICAVFMCIYSIRDVVVAVLRAIGRMPLPEAR